MGHEFSAGAASAPITLGNVDRTALREARIDLAASLRMAARFGLEEGICNHFSAMVPGRDDLFLVNPYGLMFREVTASSILVCDFEGNVVDGEGQPEATAFFIHARLHKQLPRARAAFHTHMPYSTALSMVEGDPLIWDDFAYATREDLIPHVVEKTGGTALGMKADTYKEIQFDIAMTPLVRGEDNQIVHRLRASATT